MCDAKGAIVMVGDVMANFEVGKDMSNINNDGVIERLRYNKDGGSLYVDYKNGEFERYFDVKVIMGRV